MAHHSVFALISQESMRSHKDDGACVFGHLMHHFIKEIAHVQASTYGTQYCCGYFGTWVCYATCSPYGCVTTSVHTV